MSNDKYYLRPNVVMEPLIDQWYAWPHLIPPATSAMNLVGRHLKIMESFIRSPQIHAAAVQNPAMLGGPFIDHPVEKVHEIQELMEKTKAEQALMLELASAIEQL